MGKWKVFLIGLLIVLISNILFGLLQPLLNVPEDLWASLSASLGLAYIISYNVEIKDSNVSLRMQRVVNYIFSLIIIFIIIYGLSLLINIIF